MRKPSNIDPRFGLTHLVRRGKDCTIEIFSRPDYCDRAAVEVHITVDHENRDTFVVDFADMWPRYYFDLERAKGEVEDWMDARHQRVDGEDWKVMVEDIDTIMGAAVLKSFLNRIHK